MTGARVLRIPDADPDRVDRPRAPATSWCRRRLHPGKFYALPQAPQQFKQLIMISGFDRYFQIAPCFRDEDARADRSPGEFYQLDIEMSFVTQEDVFDAVEPVLRGVFEEFAEGRPVTPRNSRASPTGEAIRKYGSDKPDLRNPIELPDVTEHFRGSGFKVFRRMIAEDRKVEVWAIPAPKGGSRAFCDRMNGWAQGAGPAGARLHLLARGRGGRRRPDRQAISAPSAAEAIRRQLGLGVGRRGVLRRRAAGEVLQIRRRGAQPGRRASWSSSIRGPVRVLLDRRFPDVRVERGGEEDRLLAQPVLDAAGRARGAEDARTRSTSWPIQYDIVCNGIELSSGAIRNHRPDVMRKAFEIAGYPRGRARGEVRRHADRASAMARRRTAASRPASTASSCCCATRPTSAK